MSSLAALLTSTEDHRPEKGLGWNGLKMTRRCGCAVDYDSLRAALAVHCAARGLQPVEAFFTKAIQLYEMIIVR